MAVLAALAVQPVVFTLSFGLPFFLDGREFSFREFGAIWLWVIAFALGHLIVLGLPIFYLLRRSKRDNWFTVGLAGFGVGSMVIAVYGWPLRNHLDGYSSGGTWHGHYREFVINGNPTLYEWLSYGEIIAMFGLHGVASAMAFYYVWRKMAARPAP